MSGTALPPNPRFEAVEAFNAATAYALNPQVRYDDATVETMCFVATLRGLPHVAQRLREAFQIQNKEHDETHTHD